MVSREDLVEEDCPHCEDETYHYYKEGRGWVCVSCNKTGSECLISTIVCASTGLRYDCRELTALRKFRDSYMEETERRRRLVREYYEQAPDIARSLVRNPKKEQLCRILYERFVLRALDHIESGRSEKALKVYSEMVHFLQKELAND